MIRMLPKVWFNNPVGVNGDFTVYNTGVTFGNDIIDFSTINRTWTGNLIMKGGRIFLNRSASASASLTVNNFTMDGTATANYQFAINNSTAASSISTFTVNGAFTLNPSTNITNGGIGFFLWGSGILGQTSNLNVVGNITHANGLVAGTLSTYNLNINGAGTRTLTSISNLANGININVNSPAILNLGTQTLNNTQTFTLANGAGLIIGSPNGISTTGNASGNILCAGTRTYGATANYTYAGIAPQITGNALTAANVLTINNASGVSATSPVNAASLNLTSGVLTTTSGTLLTLTTTAAIAGSPSATACVSGPMLRQIPNNQSAGLTLVYPLGKGGSYNPFEIVNPTTGAGGIVSIQSEVFNLNTGGTAGGGFVSLNTNRYWTTTITANAANLTSTGNVRLTETSPALNASTSGIGQSATLGGIYSYKGTNVSGSTITNTSAISAGYNFFVIGTVGPLACPSGILTIGPGGAFTSLTDAATILNSQPINCNLTFEFIAGYTATSETFPIAMNQFTYGAGGPFNVVFRPAAGVTASITGASAGGLINLAGADRITFDGRQGGVGAPNNLIIQNTNTASNTINFTNEAQNNTLQYLEVRGSTSSTTSGVVVLGTSASGLGNDNNHIDNCTIHEATTNPANLIYSAGSSTRDNSSNTISNSNFYNWGLASLADQAAISVNANNHNWTVTGNSFYLPGTFTTQGNIYGVYISSTSAANSNFTVSNNFIGGNAAGAIGTWNVTASGLDYRFCGIYANVTNAGANTIQNNTIRNFSIVSGTAFQTQSSAFTGIYTQTGSFAINSNTIGSTAAASNISVSLSSAALNNVHGIFQAGTQVCNITNNTISGLLVTNPASSANIASLYGIRVTTSAITGTGLITGNIIGSSTIANSLQNNTGNAYSSTGTIFTSGINVSNAQPANVANNQVYNVAYTANGNTTGAGTNRTNGIYRSAGTDNIIENNTVAFISSTSPTIKTGNDAAVTGINADVNSAPGHTLRNNTVHSIVSSPASAVATVASGMVMNTPATATVLQTLFSNNFSNASQWTLNVNTGSEGGTPNPWEIGAGESYPGGSCGATSSQALYIRCTSFICDLFGGGGAIYDASGPANNTNRAVHYNSNISTVGYTGLTLKFAWIANGSPASYGLARYSTDAGASWTDLPTQYRNVTTWQCASVALPVACENNPNFRIGFRWINSNNSGDVDPPMIVANVAIDGNLASAQTNLAERNTIHSISNSSTSSTAVVNGIDLVAGTNILYNNFVRMGILSNGTAQTNGTILSGINLSTGNATINHNSIYVGGSGVANAGNSHALYSNSTGTVSLVNNILVNERSNGAGTGKHYVTRFNTLTSLSSDYNLWRNTGAGAVLAAVGGTDYGFLPAWRLAGLKDINSVEGNPQFLNATGNASTVDLHISTVIGSPIESAGTPISAVTADYDNDTRASNSPVDIGADAGLFIPVDVSPPAITFSNIPLQAICSGSTITNVNVNITDNQSGISSISNLPRMYFRRTVGAPTTAWSNTNAVVGTFVSGTPQNSVWTFALDYAAFGITPAGGNQFEYYFVAQDQAPTTNIGYSQTNGVSPIHANTANLTTAPAFAFGATGTYSFGAIPLSGTVTVGTAGNYPRFNGAGGLFEAINNNGISSDLDVVVISDVAELANWTPLTTITEQCGSNFTITIRPDGNVIRTIEANSSAANAVMSFYGTTRVIVDGRFGGTGRFLRIRHNRITTVYTSTIEYNNGANNCTIRNCIVEGQNKNNANSATGSVGVLRIGGSMGFASGNLNNITIQDNQIRNLSNLAQNATNTPLILVYCGGASSSANINNITITGNELFNFGESAIQAFNGNGMSTNSIGNNFSITNNNIYQVINNPTYQYPIFLDGVGLTSGHLITGNNIGGSALASPTITGTWSNSKTDGEVVAIYVNVDNAPTQAEGTLIEGNTISNISLTGTGWGNFIGIRVENGRVTVNNNTIGSLASSLTVPNITMAGNGGAGITDNSMMAGIWTQSTEEVVIDSNIVCGLQTTSGFSFFDGIAHGSNLYFNGLLYNTPGGKATITNNQVLFSRSNSSLQNLAIPSPEGFMGIFTWTNATNNLISNNKVRNCGSGTSVWNRNVRIHGMFVGVYGSTTAQTGTVTNNEISHLFNENAGDNTGTINPIVYGLSIANGNWTVSNNTIYLNNGTQGGTLITNRNTSLRGLNDGMLFNQSNCQARYYNNTVYVSGSNLTGAGPANSTYAFLRFPLDYGSISITSGAPIELRNNIFINDRSGLGNHRAMGNIANTNGNAATNWNNTTSNYNFLATPSLTNVALWGASVTYTLANWQTLSSGGDPNTFAKITTAGSSNATDVNPSELFINIATGAANLRIIQTPPNAPWPYANIDATGITLAAVPNDIDGEVRDVTTPDIGADEIILCASPTVTTQPASQTICDGLNTSFTVVNGGLPTFTYQWEENQGSGWNALTNTGVYSDVTTATLNITAATSSMNGYLYRVVITNACGNVTTNGLASLTINAAPVITAYSPDGSPTSVNFINNICNGSNTAFGVTATGAGLTYQWELSINSGGSWSTTGLGAAPYTGATTSILSINNTPASFNTYQYRVVVTGTCSPAITSDAGLLNVGAVAINTNPPVSTVVCENGNTAITVVATGNNLTYQWQLSTNSGGSWNPISNGGVYSTATTASLTITGATNSMNTYQYRVIVGTTACTPATSTASVLTVNPLLPASVTIAAAPSNTICAGTSITFTATPTNGGVTPTYQWYLNGTPVGTNSNTYTNAALANTDQVYVEMTSNAVCPNPATSTSNTITMTVNPTLTPSVSIAAAPGITVCQSTLVTITPTPTNGGGGPTYEWFLNGVSQGISATYVSSALVNTNQVYAVMTSNATCASPVTGTSNTLTFNVRFVGQWLGYTSDWNTSSNWGCGGLPISSTDVIITGTPEGGSFPQVNSNGTAICRDIELQLGASLDVLTARDLSIYGNFTNDGSATLGAGTIRFAGAATQQILGTVTSQFGTMQVDNTVAGTAVLLQKDAEVSGNVDMTNGSLDLNGFNINLGTTGQVINETSTERIFGASGEISTTKTLAASTVHNNIAGLGVSITTDAVSPGVTVIDRGHGSQQTAAPLATAPNNSILRYFDIEPTVNAGLNATLKIDYFDVELSANGSAPVEAQLIPYRSEDGGATWEGQHFPARLSNSAAANWVQLTQIPAFSRWTLSDWLTEPLPIELLSFTATPTEVEVELEWVTASEINNDFFTVEKSLDLNLWKEVLVKDGAGNSNFTKTYNDVDKNPFSGLSYYRLKQTDFNGTFAYSEPVAVYFSRKSILSLNGLFTEQDLLHLNYLSNSTSEALITVTDIEGRIVLKTTEAASDGLNQFNYPSAHLAPGMYLVNILQNNQTKVVKVVKL